MSKKQGVWKFLFAGLIVGGVAVLYNLLVFKVLGFYPDFLAESGVVGSGGEGSGVWWRFFTLKNPMFLVFVKDFLVGFVLFALFRAACKNINEHMGKGIFYFILYSVFAFLIFSLGDFVLMRSNEGILLILTLDGFVETLICTIPIRILSRDF